MVASCSGENKSSKRKKQIVELVYTTIIPAVLQKLMGVDGPHRQFVGSGPFS